MKKILVIEDNEELREVLEEVLELSGYKVVTAEDGLAGTKKALEACPDLILCDVMMPRLDGFGVLNLLSKKPETAHIPFIFLTAKAEKEDFRRGMNLGADDYISKPFYKDELLQVIQTRLKKSEKLKTTFDGTEKGLVRFLDEAKGYEELEKLSDEKKTKTYNAKEVILYEGNFPKYLFFLKTGKVKIVKTNDYGKELIINLLSPGSFFGYTALITGENYSFGAIAVEDDTEVSLIPKEDFQQLLLANRDVSARMIKMLANNVVSKEEQLLDLAYSSVRKRVANAVLLLHHQQKEEGKESFSILRDDLARIVGTAKESVIRMLTEFRKDGYIEIIDGKISVLAEDKLRNMNV